jgi:hypothetical protein
MKRFRPLVLTAAALLVISACSTPDDLTTPTLSPQFGTTGNDSVEDVAYGKAGHLYAVGAWNSSNDAREQIFWNGSFGAEAYLRRYDRSGNMVWEKFFDIEPAYGDDTHEITARVVAVDGSGNAFVAWAASYYERVYNSEGNYYRYLATFHYLSKYSARGTRLWRVNTGNNVINDLATDSSGNVYATSDNVYIFSDHYLTKYTASGARSWQKVNGVRPTGVAVSSTNNIYTVREDGYVLKYNRSGTQLWAKTTALDGRKAYRYKIAAGVGDELYIVGAYNYNTEYSEGCDDSVTNTYYYARLYKLSSTGARQWYRNAAMMQTYDDACGNNSGWFPKYGLNVTTDSLGDAYIATGARNGDAVVTKHNRSGTLLWSKAFGSGSPLDGATSVATYDGSEVFVGAVTYGFLAHRNLGGSDAVLREMNRSGGRVWTR